MIGSAKFLNFFRVLKVMMYIGDLLNKIRWDKHLMSTVYCKRI